MEKRYQMDIQTSWGKNKSQKKYGKNMEIIWLRIKIWIKSFFHKERKTDHTYVYEEDE